MSGHDLKKTNAMRLLDQARVAYEYYEYDVADTSGRTTPFRRTFVLFSK